MAAGVEEEVDEEVDEEEDEEGEEEDEELDILSTHTHTREISLPSRQKSPLTTLLDKRLTDLMTERSVRLSSRLVSPCRPSRV